MAAAVAARPGGAFVSAQEPALRWDGRFELLTARYDYPPPWPGPLQPANAASRVSRHPVSRDGRFVVFDSDATNFGYSGPGLYLRDRRENQTQVLLAGPAFNAAISGDGGHIAFELCEPWARPDNAPICDVWSLRLDWWMWTPLSTAADGSFGDNHSGDAVLSADGRFAAFVTRAANLAGGAAGVRQVVLRDRDPDGNGVLDDTAPVVETISVGGGGAGDADSDTPEVSDDGRYVAFRSQAANLVEGDTNGTWDLFLRDRHTGQTRRLNVGPEGQQSAWPVEAAQLSMSADGRYVAFASQDGLLAPATIDDANGVADIFLFDREAPFLTRVDIGSGPPIAGGYVPGDGATAWPALSADGRYLALQSAAANVDPPPPPGSTQVYVFDRADERATRISIRTDGQDPDAGSGRPAISGDGSVVLFWSAAANLVDVPAAGWVEQLFAAVHLAIAPGEVVVPGSGGAAAFAVTAQQHTMWWAEWDYNQYWIGITEAPFGIGPGTLAFEARQPNPDPVRRSVSVHIGSESALFTQDVGLSLVSASPASGPMTGGTVVTLTGTGFVPGMTAYFGGHQVATTFVNETTLVVVTPPHDRREAVYVAVDTPDYRAAWIEHGFFYLDSSPPDIWAWAEGPLGQDDWYTGDVTIRWVSWDLESEVTATTCVDVVLTADTPGTTYTCTATSEGGTRTASFTVKRDATPPTISIASPLAQMYSTGLTVYPQFTCDDATSGAAGCVGSTGGPIDTVTPGYRPFSVSATDRAGNHGAASVEYAIGTGICAYPLPSLRSWWRFELDTSQWMSGTPQPAERVGLPADVFGNGVVGHAYEFAGGDGYLATGTSPAWASDRRFAIAAWVKPAADAPGTILSRRDGYAIARLANGHAAWAFRTIDEPGLTYLDTGVPLPLDVWTHLVVALDGSEVRTYVNGRPAHTASGIGVVFDLPPGSDITLGGADDRPDYYRGALDEVQVFDRGLGGPDVEQLFLSGAAGACVHRPATFDVTAPVEATYGDSTYTIDARLLDPTGAPLAGRPVVIESQVGASPSPATIVAITDADGRVHWDAPLQGAAAGLYQGSLSLAFDGDADYTQAVARPDVVVGARSPAFAWTGPAPVTYGAPLDHTILNASADVAGEFSYTPPPGTVLSAGSHTLTATFTPADTVNYRSGVVSTTIAVAPAPLAVRADDAVKRFGAPMPALTASFAGLVNGESPAVLHGTLALTTSASQSSPVGTYVIVPGGLDSPNYAVEFVAGSLEIVPGLVTIAVSASPEPSGYEMPMTFTAGVAAAAPAEGQPSGAVGFFDGTTLLGVATLSGGSASLTTAGLDPGTRHIEVRYDGDGSFEPGLGAASHVVASASATPTIAVSSSRNPSNAGQTVVLTATIPLPAGTVAFYDGAAPLGSAPIVGGRATLSTSALPPGSHAITARFLGTPSAPPVTSAVFVQAVGAGGWKNRSTSTAIASSGNPTMLGAPVTLIATVTSSSSPFPGGRILFMVDGEVVGDPAGVTLNPIAWTSSRASITVPGLAHGRHRVTATYLGDSTYRGSTAAVTQVVE